MEAYLILRDGSEKQLPAGTEWSFCYGSGEPCDSFTYTCPMSGEMEKYLTEAVRFRAVHNGAVVLAAIVDEINAVLDGQGYYLEVAGRGLGALLMDNCPGELSFVYAAWRDILQAVVYPVGLSCADSPKLAIVSGFTVTGAQSCWSALSDYLWQAGELCPRITPQGVLLADGAAGGNALALEGFTELELRQCPYALVSKVQDRSSGQWMSCDKGALRGVMREKTAADIYAAQRLIKEAEDSYLLLEGTIPAAFAAFPGDIVAVSAPESLFTGSFRVVEATCVGNDRGISTSLIMRPINN